jgi:inosose dehydratase
VLKQTKPVPFTRRSLLFLASAGALNAASGSSSRLSVEGYIWQQYAERQKKTLGDVIGEVLPMARKAGFRNVELNQAYFSAELRDSVLSLVKSNELGMPSVYVGGIMHESREADATISSALEIGGICKPFGCAAVVHNPSPKPNSQKTEEELRVQSDGLNRMGRALAQQGFELRVHHHSPEMASNAREWRQILKTTDPRYVWLCMDLDWVHQGDQSPLGLLREAGSRVAEIHVRNSRNKLWLESVEDGDIDYHQIAAYLDQARLYPLIVVELAYRPQTPVTRSLEEDLRLSRIYTERIFHVKA